MYMASLLSASYKVSQDLLCIKGNVQYINVTKNGTQLHSFTVSLLFCSIFSNISKHSHYILPRSVKAIRLLREASSVLLV
jgi:hypothetical protein